MKGAALADSHLGFRQFSDTTEGRNTREIDTEKAWYAAIQKTIAFKPDLVTFGGDLFHHPRVSDYAKQAFLIGIRKLVTETNAHIIIAQGNHDGARTIEVLTPIALAEGFFDRVHIVTEPKRIRFAVPLDVAYPKKVSVACFPYVALKDGPDYKLEPDPDADINVLLIHAAVKGSSEGDRLPYFYGSADQALDIGREADRWDVIAAGDFHQFTRLHPERLAFYSGSLERTSSNIWAEHAPKGVVLYDTDTGKMELAEVPNRPMKDYDLGDFDHPPGVGAEEVNGCLGILTTHSALKDTIIRFRVDEFPREERQHLDWGLVRKLKSTSTHFFLDLRFAKTEMADLGDRRENKGISLADEAIAFLKDDPEDVRDCVIKYLDLEAEVEDVEVVTEQ